MSKPDMKLENAGTARIELPDMDEETAMIVLSYNGETAFTILIENDPPSGGVAIARIVTWPIGGGEGETATVTLNLEG